MIGRSLLAAGLLAFAHATPQPGIFARQSQCNRDNCLRAVAASSIPGGSFRGMTDCSSFFVKTVTPCPVTSTTTQTDSIVGAPTTSIITETTTQTITIATTSTDTVSSGTTTITVTQTTPAPFGPAKRQASGPASCTPTTRSPSAVPTYASACSGTVRYSSACRCIGATQSTTTLTASTTISTISVTQTGTPVQFSTTTETVDEITVDSTTVTTTVPAATATVTSIVQPQSGTFNIFNSVYNTDTSIDLSRQGYLFASFDYTPGSGEFPFYIDELGYLKVYRFYIAVINDPDSEFSDFSTPTPDIPVAQRLRCVLSDPLNSRGRLTCTTFRGRSALFICQNQNRRYKIGTSVPDGCTPMTLSTSQQV